jgi:hypothetical protein
MILTSYGSSLDFAEILPDGVLRRNFWESDSDFVWSVSTWMEVNLPFNIGKKTKKEISDLVIDFNVLKSPERQRKQSVFFAQQCGRVRRRPFLGNPVVLRSESKPPQMLAMPLAVRNSQPIERQYLNRL